MSGNKLLLDTNVVLYLLSGDTNLAELIDGCQIYISFITELEVQFKIGLNREEQSSIRHFLNQCIIIDVNEEIKEQVLNIRKRNNLKLPDCLIAATGKYLEIPILTADRSFSKLESVNVIIYELT